MEGRHETMEDVYVVNRRDRGLRRKTNYKKAIRKKKISETNTASHTGWYEHLGQYIKGKIHCSCIMCQTYRKTNTKGKWAKGKKNYKISEKKKIESMDDQLKEVRDGERD